MERQSRRAFCGLEQSRELRPRVVGTGSQVEKRRELAAIL
jgi:hypothetical protein